MGIFLLNCLTLDSTLRRNNFQIYYRGQKFGFFPVSFNFKYSWCYLLWKPNWQEEMCDEHACLTWHERAPGYYTESQLCQRMSLVESPMNRYVAPMLCYWISANTVVLNIQEQCFINIEDFDRGHFFFSFFQWSNRFPRAASMYWGIEYGAEMRHRSDTGHRLVFK